MNISSQIKFVANKYAIMKLDSLYGMSKLAAKNFINKILSKHTKSIFHDENWEGVNNIFRALHDENINYAVNKSEYHHDDKGNPSSKIWKFLINFYDNREKEITLYGVITASGVGSVSDPLSSYDLVAYVS